MRVSKRIGPLFTKRRNETNKNGNGSSHSHVAVRAGLGGGLDLGAVGAVDVPVAVGVLPGLVAVFFEPVVFLA